VKHIVGLAGVGVAVTIVAWFYTWCLAWGLGERLLGARRGWILPLTVLFAGSLVPFLALSGTPATARALLGLIKIDGATALIHE